MTDSTEQNSIRSVAPPTTGNPLKFLAACGVFMLIGLMFLVWLGTDRSRSATGKDLPKFSIEPLLNVSEPLSSEQIVGRRSIIFLWSPESSDASDNLKRMGVMADNHQDYALVSIAYSQGTLIAEVLREQTRELLQRSKLDWPTYVDKSGQASMEFALLMPYGSFGFPTIFVVDVQGKIQYVAEARSPESWEALDRQLSK